MEEIQLTKKCSKCLEIQSVVNFTKRRLNKGGLDIQCKYCKKLYRLNNKEKTKVVQKKWRDKNRHIIAWRNLLHNCLTRINKVKNAKTIEMLGYSALELKNEMENKFVD